MKKYIVIGGRYKCPTDRRMRNITAKKLATLYGLNLNECILFRDFLSYFYDSPKDHATDYSTEDNMYILTIRTHHDYKHHLKVLKTERLLDG